MLRSTTSFRLYVVFAVERNYEFVFSLPQWDSKITTLPGLYIIATAILSPFNLCNIIYMRLINLIGTCVNLYLVYEVIRENCKSNRTDRWDDWSMLALAYNITLFPPLYFWCFFYYTDVWSVSTVLLMLLMHQRKRMKLAALVGKYSNYVNDVTIFRLLTLQFCTGLMAVLVRQTNIVWLGGLTVERALDIFDQRTEQPVSPRLLNTPLHLRVSKI